MDTYMFMLERADKSAADANYWYDKDCPVMNFPSNNVFIYQKINKYMI